MKWKILFFMRRASINKSLNIIMQRVLVPGTARLLNRGRFIKLPGTTLAGTKIGCVNARNFILRRYFYGTF